MLVLMISSCLAGFSQQGRSNIAWSGENVRFTVITDGVIRLEYSPDGKFVDNKSFVAVNREYPAVDFKVKTSGSQIEISTSKMTLKYKKNSGRFTADNLVITSNKGLLPFVWKPGMKQKNNLKGTYRTLDEYDGDQYASPEYLRPGESPTMPIEDGLLATDGWTLIDDSQNFLFDNSEWPWVETRSGSDVQDWYFMAYGRDYKAALKDFTVFAGKVPLPPRYAFGYWWSRYWCYTDNEFRDLLGKFHAYNIPLDVLVVDMDWHYTDPGKGGWTGYTWNRRLFPNPDEFLKFLKNNDLQITLNLHPADGVAWFEQQYPEMAKWVGANPDPAAKDTIPYLGSNKRFMSGWFNTVLRPLEKMGVDFWWLDWQQRLDDDSIKGLSNTWWINYATFSDMERNRDTRPMLYHRWGGLGNHRYQIGFSGDAVISWNSLDFQPYFNSTASNVLYGYWSHDLGGHYGANAAGDTINPELFARWMQFGAVSPIMRTHASKSATLNKEPWIFSPEIFNALRNSILERYQLAPYIYAMARKTYDEGLSLCRPLYYDYPESPEAYSFRNEYMFGDEILVAPITAPSINGYSSLDVWLPAGNDWYEWHTGTLLKGGQTVKRAFAIDEYPLYVKAGAILPTYGEVKNLRLNNEPVILTVFPGGNGSFSFYEDNGNDKNYAENYAATQLSTSLTGSELTVSVGTRRGSYPQMPSNRAFSLKILGSAAPESVLINGKSANYAYDGNELALVIAIPETDCNIEKTVKIVYPSSIPELNDGLKGKFHRIGKAVVALKYRNAGIVLSDDLGTMESANREISYYPERLAASVETFNRHYENLPEILNNQKLDDENQKWFLQSINWKK
ncbi:MAG: glycoside hydrolase family 31 protein [Dysgonamonadaceae bacterium]|nr:glycoside hydrolase family 31 protein [Dysgonamonadaceae bacterium]